MDYRFIDSNIFIEVYARSGDKAEKAKSLLTKNQSLFTTNLVISEVEWVLRAAYKLDRRKISRYLKKILVSDIKIDDKKLLINVLNYYEMNNVDWTDCLNMFLLKGKDISIVYSYDNGLNKFNWIKRLEPSIYQ